MNFATIKPVDIANGEGVRVSLFVSGCRHACKNCFNKEAWSFSYGNPFTQEVINNILTALKPDYISGLTLLGGEPFEPENQAGLLELVKQVKQTYPSKNIWCYTGFLFDHELLDNSRAKTEYTIPLLNHIDVLVDGRFVEELKDISLKFRGSKNQRLIDIPNSLKTNSVVLYNLK